MSVATEPVPTACGTVPNAEVGAHERPPRVLTIHQYLCPGTFSSLVGPNLGIVASSRKAMNTFHDHGSARCSPVFLVLQL
jgi:hypothetical protein